MSNLPALAMAENALIETLANSLYPGADHNSIRMVINYCKASELDPMQKPVHIVPIWDGKLNRMRDVVMPGIGSCKERDRTTKSRRRLQRSRRQIRRTEMGMNILQSTKELLANVAMFITETLTHYGRTAQLRRLKGLQADLAEIEGIEAAVIRQLESECERNKLEARRNARKLRINLQADIDLLSIDLGLQATRVHNFRNDKEAA